MSQIEQKCMVEPFVCDIFYFWLKNMSQTKNRVTYFLIDQCMFQSLCVRLYNLAIGPFELRRL